jgi:single-stranded-DNA-specific exonuclease
MHNQWMTLRQRPAHPDAVARLRPHAPSQLLARLCAARGISAPEQLEHELVRLLPFEAMRGIDAAAGRLAEAIRDQQRILIVGDYDADGATATALGVLGLRAMGAQVDFLVPDRQTLGYGLSPGVVEIAAGMQPGLLVTVENGIAAFDGLAAAQARGIEVLVTDHHLAGDRVPDCIIVNPNQPGCGFPSKCIAGVGVMFYVLMALRARLRAAGRLPDGADGRAGGPNLAQWLDIVAVGTVADVVRLDHNNRILVAQGLARIRAGRARPGLLALLRVAGRDHTRCSSTDIGFALGPRINAAGRIAEMRIGIDCLLADDPTEADRLAQRLDRINRERRDLQADMLEQAQAALEGVDVAEGASICLYDAEWHTGIVGLLAGRLKEAHHRPTIVFAPDANGVLKGSGRSIPGLHLRDAIDLVDRRCPGLIKQFGGHAAAAGLSLAEGDWEAFAEAFEAVCAETLDAAALSRVVESDGELPVQDCEVESIRRLDDLPWGQGFPPPLFDGEFEVLQQKVVGSGHLKLSLLHRDASGAQARRDAILFGRAELLPGRIRAAYTPSINEWNGRSSVQFTLQYWEAV